MRRRLLHVALTRCALLVAMCTCLACARAEDDLAAPVMKGQTRGDAGGYPQAAPPQQAGAVREASPGAGHVELERFKHGKKSRAGTGKAAGNAFTATSWYHPPPPPPPAPPPPPPAPTAPPLPFSYLGRYQDTQKLVVMLANGTKLYTVSQGDVIDGIYRVEAIGDDAIELMYLPLSTAQSLSTAGAPDAGSHPPGAPRPYRRP